MCVYGGFVYICVSAVIDLFVVMGCPGRPEEAVLSLGNGLANNCELSYISWETKYL